MIKILHSFLRACQVAMQASRANFPGRESARAPWSVEPSLCWCVPWGVLGRVARHMISDHLPVPSLSFIHLTDTWLFTVCQILWEMLRMQHWVSKLSTHMLLELTLRAELQKRNKHAYSVLNSWKSYEDKGGGEKGGKRNGGDSSVSDWVVWDGTCDQAPLKSQGKCQRQVPRARGERENKRQGPRDLGEWQPKGALLLSAYSAPAPWATGVRNAKVGGEQEMEALTTHLELPSCPASLLQLPAFALGRTCLQVSGTRNKVTGPCC